MGKNIIDDAVGFVGDVFDTIIDFFGGVFDFLFGWIF